MTKARQRVQNETLGHRGWEGDPLYGIRKLLLMGAERIDDRGFERLREGPSAGDTEGHVAECWAAKERVRDIDLTTDLDAPERLDDAIEWCDDSPDVPELVTLAKWLKR